MCGVNAPFLATLEGAGGRAVRAPANNNVFNNLVFNFHPSEFCQ